MQHFTWQPASYDKTESLIRQYYVGKHSNNQLLSHKLYKNIFISNTNCSQECNFRQNLYLVFDKSQKINETKDYSYK